ncbi:hypothetical protein PABG_11222 [Paracoccidioides brasiliensis Pb03]|nr:hypothetical protein PABG_11222 [Paracoccidioides brasiliensis Pb03]
MKRADDSKLGEGEWRDASGRTQVEREEKRTWAELTGSSERGSSQVFEWQMGSINRGKLASRSLVIWLVNFDGSPENELNNLTTQRRLITH